MFVQKHKNMPGFSSLSNFAHTCVLMNTLPTQPARARKSSVSSSVPPGSHPRSGFGPVLEKRIPPQAITELPRTRARRFVASGRDQVQEARLPPTGISRGKAAISYQKPTPVSRGGPFDTSCAQNNICGMKGKPPPAPARRRGGRRERVRTRTSRPRCRSHWSDESGTRRIRCRTRPIAGPRG